MMKDWVNFELPIDTLEELGIEPLNPDLLSHSWSQA